MKNKVVICGARAHDLCKRRPEINSVPRKNKKKGPVIKKLVVQKESPHMKKIKEWWLLVWKPMAYSEK